MQYPKSLRPPLEVTELGQEGGVHLGLHFCCVFEILLVRKGSNGSVS